MYKVEYFFLFNGDWKNDGHATLDGPPEKDDVVYCEEKAYRVINIRENDDGSFDVYVD